MSNKQIYSATYSNVPVFEFVTSEGPIMRRKSDSWINATHILKIAKFPKAKRTRILEKDVQSNTHEKVQGGYGKYQGTYVPLELGEQIAKNFGVFEILKPIFEFQYIEGKSETPPPAPKHNHASALNIAKRQAQQKQQPQASTTNKRIKIAPVPSSSTGEGTTTAPSSGDEKPKKRGRPKRVALNRAPASLKHSDTIPLEQPQQYRHAATKTSFIGTMPMIQRQDTEQDALQLMTTNMNLKQGDLQAVGSDEDDDDHKGGAGAGDDFFRLRGRLASQNGNGELPIDSQPDDLLTSRELFGVSRESFEKVRNPFVVKNEEKYGGIHQYRQPSIGSLPSTSVDASMYSEYFSNLVNYFLEEDNNTNKIRPNSIPEKLLNPPLPLSKIHINQPIDNDGNTIFHWACSMANIPIVEFLLNTFSDSINAEMRNNNGETALMFLVRFNNSYQLRNFPLVLQLLLESVLLVDSQGKTVLHHIVQIDKDQHKNTKKREKFSRYYMESLFDKIIESTEDEEDTEREDKKSELIAKFINHQDCEGNTAFHIAAYNLNLKCIKVFISYHRYINFGLRNLVSCTVEDYLASHNYVLRLDDEEQEGKGGLAGGGVDGDKNVDILVSTGENGFQSHQSFETQLYNSKLALNLQNTTSNLITEKMTQLAYTIDKELSEKDEVILTYFKILKKVNQDKLASQRKLLSFFNLDYLIDDLDTTNRSEPNSQESNVSASQTQDLSIDFSKDKIIQEEIYRLINDLTYQYLQKENEFDNLMKSYKVTNEKVVQATLAKIGPNMDDGEIKEDQFTLMTQLQESILKRRTLMNKIYKYEMNVPTLDEGKENKAEDSQVDQQQQQQHQSLISKYGSNDKLTKYCKLIALCCGMSTDEVENSIDLIEQSLVDTKKK
ncbi:MBP1 [[Candida] subhashii]|uniref:Transcription factor MBP1 n=1 Tax=[Candida] subhashii TaxID=561895 RepID=A0A8J5QNS5_9ASCO|nr:MBP1 [[Candida] subhashii]KAG7664944.1 MBP1 [[Candida] subhashii]